MKELKSEQLKDVHTLEMSKLKEWAASVAYLKNGPLEKGKQPKESCPKRQQPQNMGSYLTLHTFSFEHSLKIYQTYFLKL